MRKIFTILNPNNRGIVRMLKALYPYRLYSAIQGFTLGELLISLAILAVIATFTIPKVLQSQQSTQRITVFKETIAAITQIFNEGYQSGQVTPTYHGGYVMAHINAVKICSTNSVTQGCWTQADSTGESTQPGFVLANGATVAGLSSVIYADGFVIDWNGAAGPNVQGDDQLYLEFCASPQALFCYTNRPWSVIPYTTTGTVLYQTIFQ